MSESQKSGKTNVRHGCSNRTKTTSKQPNQKERMRKSDRDRDNNNNDNDSQKRKTAPYALTEWLRRVSGTHGGKCTMDFWASNCKIINLVRSLIGCQIMTRPRHNEHLVTSAILLKSSELWCVCVVRAPACQFATQLTFNFRTTTTNHTKRMLFFFSKVYSKIVS